MYIGVYKSLKFYKNKLLYSLTINDLNIKSFKAISSYYQYFIMTFEN